MGPDIVSVRAVGYRYDRIERSAKPVSAFAGVCGSGVVGILLKLFDILARKVAFHGEIDHTPQLPLKGFV